MDAVEALVSSPDGEALRRRHRVGRDTFLDVMAVWAGAADVRTGRGMALAHETVAAQLGCSTRHVGRAAALAEALGVARTMLPGGYLAAGDRREAERLTGARQIRIASVRALTQPRPTPSQDDSERSNVHLPHRGIEDPFPSVGECLPSALPLSRQGHRRPAARAAPTNRWQPPGMWSLAEGLARALPWLRRHRTSQVARVLTNVGVDPTDWTVSELLDAIDGRNRARGWFSLSGPRNPLGFLCHTLRDVLSRVEETPGARRRREAETRGRERLAEAERGRAQAARRAELEADPEWTDRQRRALEEIRAAWSRPRPKPVPGPFRPVIDPEAQAALIADIEARAARLKAEAAARRRGGGNFFQRIEEVGPTGPIRE
ncbi:MAG: hypothetical protein LBK54_06595 [Propionibacteriaceae bacterium]|nr:hypothetical protein [Propionibacteriaceae bacterium]